MQCRWGEMSRTETYVPEHTRESIKQWIEHGVDAGSFINALMANDLFLAISKADDRNKTSFTSIVSWIWNYAPAACYGSYDICQSWADNFNKKKVDN